MVKGTSIMLLLFLKQCTTEQTWEKGNFALDSYIYLINMTDDVSGNILNTEDIKMK